MSPTQGLQASGNSHPRPHRTATVSEYTVKAYYLPRYSSFSLSSNAPNRLIDASVKLKASDWSIDLSQVFPSGTNADSYFVGGPPQNWPTPPCFCGQTLGNVKETEVEEQNDEWDAYWDCTAICKLRRRYQAYMGEQEKLYGEKMGGNPFEYILFVEGGGELLTRTVANEHWLMGMNSDNGDQDEVPLLDRESEFELDVPMSERAMVMVRVEGWIPVDVKPIIVESIVAPNPHSLSITFGG